MPCRGFFGPPFIFSPLNRWVFLIRGGILVEGMVEMLPGLHKVALASGLVHLSPVTTIHVI